MTCRTSPELVGVEDVIHHEGCGVPRRLLVSHYAWPVSRASVPMAAESGKIQTVSFVGGGPTGTTIIIFVAFTFVVV